MSIDTKRTCSRCLRSQHAECTAGEACACPTCNPPVVVWEDPPQWQQHGGHRARVLTVAQIEQLKAHPGRWARIKDYAKCNSAHSQASSLTKKQRTLADGTLSTEFEFVGRSTGAGTAALYARYIGPKTNGDGA